MNYIPRNGIDSEDEPKYEEIRKIYDYQHLYDIYKDLQDFPLIKFKDSMVNRLNIIID